MAKIAIHFCKPIRLKLRMDGMGTAVHETHQHYKFKLIFFSLYAFFANGGE